MFECSQKHFLEIKLFLVVSSNLFGLESYFLEKFKSEVVSLRGWHVLLRDWSMKRMHTPYYESIKWYSSQREFGSLNAFLFRTNKFTV